MTVLSQQQAANIVPPRVGQILAIAVDATPRSYALSTMRFAQQRPTTGPDAQNHFYVTLSNDGASNIYLAFDTTGSSTILDTTITSAGGTPALDSTDTAASNAQADVLFPNQTRDVRLCRQLDKYLLLKCAAGQTSTLRLSVSSEGDPGASQ